MVKPRFPARNRGKEVYDFETFFEGGLGKEWDGERCASKTRRRELRYTLLIVCSYREKLLED